MYLEGNSDIFQLDACSRNWLPFIPYRQGLYCLIAYSHMCTPIHCCHMVHCYSSLSHGAVTVFGCYVQVFVQNLLHLWVVELEKVVMADTFTQLSVIYVT